MQDFERRNGEIRERFLSYKRSNPEKMRERLRLSWSNWGFGMEPPCEAFERLSAAGVEYIELHGNHYGRSIGYDPAEINDLSEKYGIRVAGICGMYSSDQEFASHRPAVRQAAIDYTERELSFGRLVGASYMLVVPAAVGRPAKLDAFELERSAETLKLVAGRFRETGIRCAIEPIRSAEVSIVHTFDEAEAYIELVNDPAVQHINGDVYHMLAEERHIASTIAKHGHRLTNLHLADTNRGSLGDGSLDLAVIIMALYLIGHNEEHRYCTAEPLGPGGDPYPAMYGKPDQVRLAELISRTVSTWHEQEDYVRSL